MSNLREALLELMSSDEYKETRVKAVKRSHEFLDALEDCGPLELTLFLSHCFSHLLMSAPDEDDIKEMFAVFTTDLDIQEIIKDHRAMAEAEDKGAEEEVEGRKPSIH